MYRRPASLKSLSFINDGESICVVKDASRTWSDAALMQRSLGQDLPQQDTVQTCLCLELNLTILSKVMDLVFSPILGHDTFMIHISD